MSSEELVSRLTRDLADIHLPIDEVDVIIRPYSKTYYGRYYPSVNDSVRPRIYLYPFKNKCGALYSYSLIMQTLIHEMVHHIQYTNDSFVRVKGVMHDVNFWKLYNRYVKKAEQKIGGLKANVS